MVQHFVLVIADDLVRASAVEHRQSRNLRLNGADPGKEHVSIEPGWPAEPGDPTPFLHHLHACIACHSAHMLMVAVPRYRRFVFDPAVLPAFQHAAKRIS